MAIPEQVEILQRGGAVWNEWRREHPYEVIHLSGANLSQGDLVRADLSKANLNRANLIGADLSNANLSRSDLIGTDLSNADFIGANLIGANLGRANLSRADLTNSDINNANLSYASLNGANLSNANLSYANLGNTDLNGANLNGSHLSGATIGWTIFGNLDLRTVKGLETIRHQGPSTIGTDTLERSEGDIPEAFLRGAGLSDTFITYARSLVRSPIEYYTCFISYASKDQGFAERLYADLQNKGIRCWYAPEDLRIGDHFPERIEEAIRHYDKLLVILSAHSVSSSWVEDEVRAAQEKEEHFKREQCVNKTVLFPIAIDTAIEQAPIQWAARMRRQRHIGDFRTWKDHDSYQKAFARLLRDLQQVATPIEPHQDQKP